MLTRNRRPVELLLAFLAGVVMGGALDRFVLAESTGRAGTSAMSLLAADPARGLPARSRHGLGDRTRRR